MRVAIIGGKLQGIEAAYLARKAGWETLLIDRNPDAPASGLTDRCVQLDVTLEKDLDRVLKNVNLAIATLEAPSALHSLQSWFRQNNSGTPLIFDFKAHRISASKRRSQELFDETGVPTPLPWPQCGFPILAKPDSGSGSKGVTLLHDFHALQNHLNTTDGEWVLQEFIRGPTYSIEIVGFDNRYVPLQITDLEMDSGYDCKRVSAPTELNAFQQAHFRAMALKLAERLQLKGLMDVEVILHDGELKVLEIDARLPSQTPTAVYWSSEINLIQLLGEMALKSRLPAVVSNNRPRGVIYEHIRVSRSLLEVQGEHIMSGVDPLHIENDFWGADEAITNYAPGRNNWVGTLIFVADNRMAAWEKRHAGITEIRRHFKLDQYRDPSPKD